MCLAAYASETNKANNTFLNSLRKIDVGAHVKLTLKVMERAFSFRKKISTSTCIRIVSSISPILSHNSEIWGVYVKHDFKAWDNTPIEKTHLKFCKRYLEISNKASNVASRSELGRLPLIINIYKNILYYILYLLRKNEDTIS